MQPRGANEQRKGWRREKTNLGQMCDLTSFTSPHTHTLRGGWREDGGGLLLFYVAGG